MPTWSFLNRDLMAGLVAAGYRCISADHIGFGRSDKPVDEAWYSILRHVDAHRSLIEVLDLQGVTLFCQDWGGPIGLAQAVAMPDRFSGLVIMNTWLHHPSYVYTPALKTWNQQWQPGGLFELNVPDKLSIGWFMMVATGHMKASDLYSILNSGAYPFEALGRAGQAGMRRFPLSLPFYDPVAGAAQAQEVWFEKLLEWRRPIHFIWGGKDDVFTEEWGRQWASCFSHSRFDLIPEAGHFLQETHGAHIADLFLTNRP